jgi:transposase
MGTVQLNVHVRKLFCCNKGCRRRIFAERIPTLSRPWARSTVRLQEVVSRVGVAVGGSMGVRVLGILGVMSSVYKVLRAIRRVVFTPPDTPRVLGVDDWALKRGERYCTILVDLETHRPVELLPERTAKVVMDWLQTHPGVEVVSRDRAGAYAEAAQQAVPEAVQVSDRWHLLRNLWDALSLSLERHRFSPQKVGISGEGCEKKRNGVR